uniref:Uncharacterized protein n=1 Tax=Rhizophora mucronata TaxID=61149 RepID=A0A2P2NJM0_RHIMU
MNCVSGSDHDLRIPSWALTCNNWKLYISMKPSSWSSFQLL